MIADRDDFAASVKDRKQERNVSMLPMARMLAGAAPVMEALTKDANWNRYLTMLQGVAERASAQAESAARKLTDPALWKHEEMLKLKADVLVGEAIVQTLQLAIGLPKAIMEGAGDAQTIINEFEAKREAAGQPKP